MTPARITEFALVAADYVRQSLHIDLDGSVESLAFVDHYLSKVGKVSNQVMELVATAVGAYFGEVVISRLGGDWHVDGDDPGGWTITIEAAPLRFRPIAMAAEAVRKQARPDDRDRVVQAVVCDIAEGNARARS